MFGIGFGEMLVIAVILLIAVGPRQLPSLMKTVGKGMREVRKASGELRRTVGIEQLLADDDLRDPMRKTPPRHKLTPSDLERESPPEGVDVAALRQKTEEAARVAATTAAEVPAAEATSVEAPPEPVSEKS